MNVLEPLLILEELNACLTGAQIFSLPAINAYAIKLRKLVSAPEDIYKELYIPTLHNFMALCQAMPSDIQNPIAYSLLTQRLSLAIAALKLRRGCMLPKNSNSETIAEQEPLWTYALFTTSLLIKIHHIQSDRTIELYQDKNKTLGVWHAVVGSLYEADTSYKIIPQEQPLKISNEILQAMLLEKIIPQIGMRWLSSCQDVFSLWLEAVIETNTKNNVLIELIQEAAQKIDFPLIEKTMRPLELSELAPEPSLLSLLMEWIQQSDGEHRPPYFLRFAEGLFVTPTALTTFITQRAIKLSLAALMKEIESALLKKEENHIFQYCSVRFEDRQILEGVIIHQEHLTDTLKSYPIKTDFIPNISLQEESC